MITQETWTREDEREIGTGRFVQEEGPDGFSSVAEGQKPFSNEELLALRLTSHESPYCAGL